MITVELMFNVHWYNGILSITFKIHGTDCTSNKSTKTLCTTYFVIAYFPLCMNHFCSPNYTTARWVCTPAQLASPYSVHATPVTCCTSVCRSVLLVRAGWPASACIEHHTYPWKPIWSKLASCSDYQWALWFHFSFHFDRDVVLVVWAMASSLQSRKLCSV